jgi:hypothetical protein
MARRDLFCLTGAGLVGLAMADGSPSPAKAEELFPGNYVWSAAPSGQVQRPSPVSRLTFAYEGDQVRLVSEHHVTMIIPPSHPIDRLEIGAGFSVILRDDRGEAVYGRVMESPFRFDEEVFDKDPKRSIRREANPKPKGTFVVLVPAIGTARRLEFFSHPLKPKAHLEPRQRIATFQLSPLPKR